MAKRTWDPRKFDETYARFICSHDMDMAVQSSSNEYYSRYRSRYKTCIKRFCDLAPQQSCCVLDIGGGQLALLCKKLWDDNAWVADLSRPHLEYMRAQGVGVVEWNLCKSEQPVMEKFDVVFFSEVIEHLPVPGHVVLEKLKEVLKPGGVIICTTPNFHRIRNIVFMALGRQILDRFYVPESGSLGHVIEYSREHLLWQFDKAGFKNCQVEYCQMHHSPTNPIFRILSWFGYPLFLVPRLRDNLLAIAYAP
ncbi:MAG: class I SAM-dependent methyltransferase [Nitrospira sp.]